MSISRADDLTPDKVDETAGTASPSIRSTSKLGLALTASDIVACTVGWAVGLTGVAALSRSPGYPALAWTLIAAVCTVLMTRAQQLHRARVSAVRATEMRGLLRSTAYTGTGLLLLAPLVSPAPPQTAEIVIGVISSFLLLASSRSLYRAWIVGARRVGRHTRDVVLVGMNEEAAEFLALTRDHPEMGIRVTGLITDDATPGCDLPVMGTLATAGVAASKAAATGAVVVASALQSSQLNAVVRDLLDRQVHVHLSTGLHGIAHSRIRSVPMSHEPLLYVEPSQLSSAQLVAKRALDVAVAGLACVAALPVLVAAAVMIRMEDRGPVIFRQKRVGKDGEMFTVYKLRTMVMDAEARAEQYKENNQRDNSPLFKMAADPRVTRIGRFLRVSSIDELPQLLNVLQGTMSLVGPRPAIPAEVAQFDHQFQSRSRVQPGMTGLWQVEARDNPSFGPYRRLDLFYVENWSVGLDIVIILGTAASVLSRLMRLVLPRGSAPPNSLVLE